MGVSQPDPMTGHPKRHSRYKMIKAQFKVLICSDNYFYWLDNYITHLALQLSFLMIVRNGFTAAAF